MNLRFQIRVALLVSAGLIPLLLYGGWLAQAAREQARIQSRGATRADVNHAVESWSTAIHEVRGLLSGLAVDGRVAGGGLPCEQALHSAATRLRQVAALAVLTADGRTRCASEPEVAPVVLHPPELLASVPNGDRPTLGWVDGPRAAGPAVAVAVKGEDSTDTLVAVLRVESLRDTVAMRAIPGDATLLLVTPTGSIIASDPPDFAALGTPIDNVGLHAPLLQPKERAYEDTVLKDEAVVTYMHPLRPAGLGPEGYLLVGVPLLAADATADAFRTQIVFSGWVAVFLVLASLGAAADRLLVRPMRRLTDTAERLGTTAATAPSPADADEFDAIDHALRSLHGAIDRGGAPFRSAVELAAEGVCVVTTSGRIISANPAATRLLGLRQDQILGASLHNLVHGHQPDHAEAECPLLAPLRHGGGRREGSDTFHRLRGDTLPVRWSAVSIEDGVSYGGAVLVFEDRTGVDQTGARMGQSARLEALGELAGAVAHDFNNLLTAMIGYADLLSDQVTTDEARRDIEEILAAAQRATTLSHQLLTLARRRDDDRPCTLNAIVEDMERLFARLIGDRIELRLHLDPTIDRVKAGAGQVEQLLLNLVVNARDAMPEGGRLEIRTRRTRGADGSPFAALIVSDTGVGIPAELRSRLFEPFFTTKPEGTGLGLATVSRIVTDIAGRLEVDSAPGSGSTFSIHLPVHEEGVRHDTTTPVPEDPRGTETIVLVEDDAAVRTLASRTLRSRGYEVREARDAHHALELLVLDGRPADLLLTDVVMPGLNGEELYAYAIDRLPGLRVLYTTGYDRGHNAHEVTLLKPFTAVTLGVAVRARLDAPPPSE